MKHTQGPWRQSHRETQGGGHSTQVYDSDGETIATLAWYPIKTANGVTTNRDANARLIAAAPDMLAALIDCADQLAVLAKDPKSNPWVQEARAAIAKATGGP